MLHHVYALLPTSNVQSQFLLTLTEKWRDYMAALFEDAIQYNENGMLHCMK